MSREKILLHYLRDINYKNDSVNQIGTDQDFLDLNPVDSPVRVIPTPSGDIAYVRKFGYNFSETDITTIAAPSTNLTVKIYALDGTLLGSRANGGAFQTEGTASTSQGIYITFTASGAATIDSSIPASFPNAGIVNLHFTAEVLTASDVFTFYVSRNGSSFYDSEMIHGGARHTPVLNSEVYSYQDIATAYSVLAASNNDGVCILDSKTYDEDLTSNNQALDSADTIIYAAAGESPNITRGVGARITREVSKLFTNLNALYFNQTGNDSTGDGTWQNPFKTLSQCDLTAGSKDYVYGGTGATVTSSNLGMAAYMDYNLEPEYGYTPEFYFTSSNYIISTGSGEIRGCIFDANSSIDYCIYYGSGSNSNLAVYDNTFTGSVSACIYAQTNGTNIGLLVNRNLFHSSARAGIYYDGDPDYSVRGEIINNIFYSLGTTGIYIQSDNSGYNVETDIKNNKIYDCSGGIRMSITNSSTFSSDIENNTTYNCTSYGLFVEVISSTWSGNCRNNIFWDSSSDGLYYADIYYRGAAFSVTNTIYRLNDGFTIGAGCSTDDPKLCKITTPYQLGISSDSPGYRADSNIDDMGAIFRSIEIAANDIQIQGINILGNNYYNNAVSIINSTNYTGLIIKYCNINNFQGIAIDLYDNDTDIDSIISNNLISGNGNGINLNYGGNLLEENCIFNNAAYGTYINNNVNTINHSVFYNNQTGIKLTENAYGVGIRNSIFNSNSLYSIDSFNNIAVYYCCITDGYGANVNVTDSSNINTDPLLISTVEGQENFNIKTIEYNWLLDSPCKETGESGKDIGAYNIDRGVNYDWYKKYQLTYNPIELNPSQKPKGINESEGPKGGLNLYAKEHKNVFNLIWGGKQLSSKEMKLTISLLTKLIQTRKNQYSKEQTRIRLHLRPETFLETGEAATINSSTKKISDTTKSWIQDEWEGYSIGIKFTKGSSNGVISASGKTLTVSGAGWTVDEWEGYYIYHNKNYYYIESNTSEVLTLGDPESTLLNESGIDWAIEKYFKIKYNTDSEIELYDENSELVSGSYDYYIDFIYVKVTRSEFNPIAAGIYDFENEELKTGYSLNLEQE